MRLASLKKREDALVKERARLEADKVSKNRLCRAAALSQGALQTRHLRELKRIHDEDASRFSKARQALSDLQCQPM